MRPGNPHAPRASKAEGGGSEYMMMVKMAAQEILLFAVAHLPDLILAGVLALTGVLIYLISAYGAAP